MFKVLIIPVQKLGMASKKIYVSGSSRKGYYRTIKVKKK